MVSNKVLNDKEGMTLIEIIVALAILGIVLIALLNVFTFSMKGVYSAGHRTASAKELQGIADTLINANKMPTGFATQDSIRTYLSALSTDYHREDNLSNVTTYAGYPVNFNVSTRNITIGPSAGYNVTLVRFFEDNKKYTKMTAFIVEGGL